MPTWATCAGLAFAPKDATRLAVCGGKGLKVYSLADARPCAYQGQTESDWWCVAFSPNGQRLAAGGASGTVSLWDTATGRELLTLTGHKGNVPCVAFSPNGRRLASCDGDGWINLWDSRTGWKLLSLTGHNSYLTGVAFSSDGQFLASCGHDGFIRLWDGRP